MMRVADPGCPAPLQSRGSAENARGLAILREVARPLTDRVQASCSSNLVCSQEEISGGNASGVPDILEAGPWIDRRFV
jgi:hypothetical protein